MRSFFFGLILLTTLPFSFAQAVIQNVDAQSFQTLLNRKDYVLIDLRTNEEISKKGMIPGALQIDYFASDSEKRIQQLDRKKTYLLYCAGGGRSMECAELMQKLGFRQLINLEKGFDDWERKGFETTTQK